MHEYVPRLDVWADKMNSRDEKVHDNERNEERNMMITRMSMEKDK